MKHAYISTACQHELHESCRRQCKYCEEYCLCLCHDAEETRWGDVPEVIKPVATGYPEPPP